MTYKELLIGYVFGFMLLLFFLGMTIGVIKVFKLEGTNPSNAESSIMQVLKDGEL